MTGGLNGDTTNARQTRYKYSPVHQDVAVCCAPNAGRIAPNFVDRMWMRSGTGLVATLLGPCRVTTNWNGTPLRITEKTTYPNDLSFDFEIDAANAVRFTLAIRKPAWVTGASISFDYKEKDGYFLITRTWQPGESLHIRLLTGVMTRKDRHDAAYFTYGPLVLARPIDAIADTIRRYALPGFYDYHYRPDNLVVYSYQGDPVEHSGNERFEAILFDSLHNSKAHVWLKPMGGTMLRQVTFPRSGPAQSIDRTRLDSLFDNLAAHNLALGDIAITQNGKPVYHRTVGKGQDPEATYRVGSISKLFTATMIYELIDEKRLLLDDTLGKFFPDIPNAGTISIAEMLGHRSGLANFTAEITGFDHWKEQPHTHEQLTGFIKSQPPDFAPGKKADYNNSNFLLLGYILEKIYHQSYKDLVTERIIQKLGLRHTYYGDGEGFRSPEVPSFKYVDNQWKPEHAVDLDNFGGAGAMISTPQDLCQFITAIFNGKFIGKSSLARMTRIENDGYGWGMFSFGDSLHTGYGHSGQTEGFASSVRFFPQTGLAIGYCTNGEVYPKDDILDEVFGICFGKPIRIPTFIPVHLTKDQVQPLTGNYTGDNVPELTCSLINDSLSIGIKGQQFALEALSDHEFRNVRFGFFFEFDPANKQLIVHDAATTYWLHRK